MAKSWFGKYIEFLGNNVDSDLEKIILKYLPHGDKLTYLDLGCYDGEKTIIRAQKIGTKKVMGLDLPTIGAEKARKRGVKVIYGDLDKKWPIKANSVDCITATEVIEHMADTDNFFEQLRRVLRPGGKVLITTDNLAAYHNIFALILGNQPYTGPFLSKKYPIGHRPFAKYYEQEDINQMRPHLNVMTAKSLRQLLEVYGFKVLHQDGAGMYPLPPFVARVFAPVFKNHASHCLFVAQVKKKKNET